MRDGGEPTTDLTAANQALEARVAELERAEQRLQLQFGVAHALAELALPNEALAVILEGVADGITARTPDGRLVYANEAAARIIGFDSPADFLRAAPSEARERFEIFGEDGRPFPAERLTGSLAVQGQETPPLTLRYRVRATGEESWSLSRSRPVFDEQGAVALVVTIFHDVSALKRRELAQRILAEAGRLLATRLSFEERLQGVARMAVPLLADWCVVDLLDEDGSIRPVGVVHVDPQMVALAGKWRRHYPIDPGAPTGVAKVIRSGEPELVPLITDDMLAAIDDPALLVMVQRVGIHSVMIVPITARGRTFGAATFVWAESGRQYGDEDLALAEELGRRAGLAADNARLYEASQHMNVKLEARVARRTAELEQANARLENQILERRRTEEHLRVLLESAPDAIVIADEAGLIVQVNSQTERLFGYRAEQLLGHRVDVLLPRRFQTRHRRHRAAYAADPRTRSMGVGLDLWARRRDGSEFPVEVSLSPLNTDQGPWVMSAIRDITVRRQAQADLVEMQRRLVDGREAERLLLAQDLHDGPVQGLFGLAYQLAGWADAGDDADRRGRVATLRDGLRDVTDMLRTICVELRPPALAPFGLETAIRSRIERLAKERPELAVTVALTPDRQVLSPRVRLALYRIFQEALSNVVRHAGARHASISLELDAEGAVLEVIDDGIGFTVPERWVRFARDGHLGLVGASERAEAVGGRLYVASEPGHGTRIHVAVPLVEPMEMRIEPDG